MDLDTLLSFEWSIMAPEFTILIVATILSIADLFMSKKVDRRPFGWIAIAGIIVALAFLVGQLDHGFTEILFDTYRLDGFSKAFKLILLVGTLIVFLLAIPYEKEGKLSVYRGEFYYLLLTALLGAMMMASSADIITLFVGLELLTISSYILAGLKKNSLKSNEAAMKYVVMGGISTAITLFGLSYIYGLTGSTKLVTIAQQLQTISADSQSHALVALAFIITFVGLAFKISSAPFHMWAPDVYEGAPTPV
ncbi:proton-conducting transporter membrane subunit, partial [Bacillaceae bacterium S4-13-58]